MYVEFIKTKLCSCEIDVVQLCYYFKHCNWSTNALIYLSSNNVKPLLGT